jgi:hypothetical protein
VDDPIYEFKDVVGRGLRRHASAWFSNRFAAPDKRYLYRGELLSLLR